MRWPPVSCAGTTPRPKDIGIQTSRVLSARDTTAAAMAATAAGLTGRTGGNGSLMRTAPVALAYLHDGAARADAAAAVSRLTHADQRATEACQIWCELIARAVLDGQIDRDWVFLASLGDGFEEFWRPLKVTAETGSPADFANNGWVVHALQTAWWAITHTSRQQTPTSSPRVWSSRSGQAATPTRRQPSPAPCWAPGGVRQRYRPPGVASCTVGPACTVTTWSGWRSRQHKAEPGPGPGRRSRSWSYAGYDTGHATVHPHDDGVLVGGSDAVRAGGYDAVVSLCRMGTDRPRRRAHPSSG